MIYKNLTDLIGHTPLLEIQSKESGKARILAKLEYFNPGGSVKDRVALSMIEDAEKRGLLKKAATIIEPTSGNTGVGLAWVGVSRGYKVILTMPETMSLERRNLLKALGAKVILTAGELGMNGAITKAEELKNKISDSVILGQFDNPANPAIHEATTGMEIWNDTEGDIDIFVAGAGTGGTISGIGKSLKAKNKDIRIIAVEPASSAVLSGEKPGKHQIQGIGAGFIPKTFDSSVIDDIYRVSDNDAIRAARTLAGKGILVGISSGAAFHAAFELAQKEDNKGKTIVVLLPDTGERYLSTVLFAFDNYPV